MEVGCLAMASGEYLVWDGGTQYEPVVEIWAITAKAAVDSIWVL